MMRVGAFGAFLACLTVANARPGIARSVSSVSVSVGGQNVYGLVRGKRVRLLRACPNEVFFGADGTGATAPHVSPNGRYVILERLWPYQARGRVDESTVLFDANDGRTYSSTYYGRLFRTGTPIETTWVARRPATLDVYGDESRRRVELPSALAKPGAPDRCSSR